MIASIVKFNRAWTKVGRNRFYVQIQFNEYQIEFNHPKMTFLAIRRIIIPSKGTSVLFTQTLRSFKQSIPFKAHYGNLGGSGGLLSVRKIE